jgi:hypothetical protein
MNPARALVTAMVLLTLSTWAQAQWLNYPTILNSSLSLKRSPALTHQSLAVGAVIEVLNEFKRRTSPPILGGERGGNYFRIDHGL